VIAARSPDSGRGPGVPATVVYVQPSSEVGGSDIALFRLVGALDRSRFRPVVVLPGDGPLVASLRAANVPVRFVPMLQLRPIRDPVYQLRFALGFWPAVIRLARLIQRERAQVVHSNSLYTLYGMWASRLVGRPHVWHIREIPSGPESIRRALATVVRRGARRVVPMTYAVAELFGPREGLGPSIVPIPDGIDVAEFHPSISGARIRSELGIAPEAAVVGFVARLDPWKGADVFVRAAAEILRERPDTRFIVCGGELAGYESYAKGIRDLASRAGLDGRITFTEWRYRLGDIPEVMAAIDVLLHPPIGPEPFGLVLVEAMATARPVVASRIGGITEVVVDGLTGELVPPGDWRAAASAVLRLLNDPARAQRMGAAGRARAMEEFEVGAYALRIEALYDAVLAEQAA
jgi:glycosyltransferase involved in cell wall biosynthesis